MRKTVSGVAVAFLAAGLLAVGAPAAQANHEIDVTKTVTDLNGGNFEPGDTVEYEITVTDVDADAATEGLDDGAGDALRDNADASLTNIRITGNTTGQSCFELDPEGTQGPAMPPDDGFVADGDDDVRCDAPITIPSNGSVSLTLRAEIEAGTAGEEIVNCATALDDNGTDETDCVSFTVAGPTVTKTANPTTGIPGDPIEFTIDIGAAGGVVVGAFEVRDNVDNRFTNINVTSANADLGSTITCNVVDAEGDQGPQPPTTPVAVGDEDVECTGDLQAGDNAQVVIEATIADGIAGGETLVNAVTVDDLDGNDASDTATVNVSNTADLEVTKTASQEEGEPGDIVEFTVVTTNNGPNDANAVELDDDFDADFQDIQIVDQNGWDGCAFSTNGATGADNPDVECNEATLAAGDSLTLVLEGQIETDANFPVRNRATVSATEADSDTSNNTAEATINEPGAGTGEPTQCKGFADGDVAPNGGVVIVGTSGDDTLTGTADGDLICGHGGNDTIDGLGGDDELLGGPGNDDIFGGPGDDRIAGHDGVDDLRCQGGTCQIFGGAGDDNITGGTGDDRLAGNNGNDSITGNDGDDRIFGGAGDDTDVHGGNGNDRVVGNNGNDTLFGDTGDDFLHGGAGTDTGHGGTGTDTCNAIENEIDCEN